MTDHNEVLIENPLTTQKRPRGRPGSRTAEMIVNQSRTCSLNYYYKTHAAKPKSNCLYIGPNIGQCNNMTNRGYCYKHIKVAKKLTSE